jgi:hypothetical protein
MEAIMAIDRKSFSSILPASEQPEINKLIVANTTMRGYLHLVAVRTVFENEQPIEKFTDVLIHPDRAADIDVAKFDAVSLQGLTPRLAPGEKRDNTTYHWGSGAKAIGKHLIKRMNATEPNTPDTLVYAGVGLYGTPEPTVTDQGFGNE